MVLNLGTTLRYYKKIEIQEELVKSANGKEVGIRFNEKFGKRPDTLIYPQDVMEVVKKGATSFHCSEETWDNPLDLFTGIKKKELEELRIGWDLILDVDCAIFEYSRICADLIVKFLKYSGVKNIFGKFSGNKGFHIAVAFESFPDEIGGQKMEQMFPEAPQKIAFYIKENIKHELERKILEMENNDISQIVDKVKLSKDKITRYEKNEYGDKISKLDVENFLEIDTILISSRHLFRMPYSLHEKSGLISLPIDVKQIMKFEKHMADPDKFFSPLASFLDRSQITEQSARNILIRALDFEVKKEYNTTPEYEQLRSGPPKEMVETKIESPVQKELFPPCIKLCLNGLEDGKKRAVFAMILFLGKLGWTKQAVQDYLLKWNKEVNNEPLRDNYIIGQMRYFKPDSKLPPNCDNQAYYTVIGVCKPDGLCKKIKNPVNYSLIKLRIKRQYDEEQKKEEEKLLRKQEREKKKRETAERKAEKISSKQEKHL